MRLMLPTHSPCQRSRPLLSGCVCQARLGLLYRDGHGVEADPHAAAKWLEAAALKGDRDAAFLAGTVHGKSFGDMLAAAKWFERAANAGHAAAAANLGTFYARGIGVKADKSVALNWFLLAAAFGHETAGHIADGLAEELANSGGGTEGVVHDDTEPRGRSDQSGSNGKKDDEESISSGESDSQTLYERGMMYITGRATTEVDPVTNRAVVNRTHGLVLLQRAADKGHAAALNKARSSYLDQDRTYFKAGFSPIFLFVSLCHF